MPRKAKKQIKGMMETSMIGAAGSLALGGIGGTSAVHGQAGIAAATGYMPSIGTMAGVGMLTRAVQSIEPKKRKKKKGYY